LRKLSGSAGLFIKDVRNKFEFFTPLPLSAKVAYLQADRINVSDREGRPPKNGGINPSRLFVMTNKNPIWKVFCKVFIEQQDQSNRQKIFVNLACDPNDEKHPHTKFRSLLLT